jgi:hypothetical protein
MAPLLRCWVAAGVIGLAVSVACGSPDAVRKDFTFTPVAFTPVPEQVDCSLCSRGTARSESGEEYFADRVVLVVRRDAEAGVRDELNSYGFTVLRRIENRPAEGMLTLLVEVPLGSALAAVELLSSHDAVETAELSGFRRAE